MIFETSYKFQRSDHLIILLGNFYDANNDNDESGPDETRQLREDVARLQVLQIFYYMLLLLIKIKNIATNC